MSDSTSALAIAVPGVVALASLLVQAYNIRQQRNTELAKMFYEDRIASLSSLTRSVSEILKSAESAIKYRDTLKLPFDQLWHNSNGKVPAEIHQGFQAAIYGATVMGSKKFKDEVDNNLIFYPDQIQKKISKFASEYFDKIPDPLRPESIDRFLESSIPVIRKHRDSIVNESQKIMELKV
ncbi:MULTISPECIES: hypothetical protein [unclassified Alcanivorax]|uniref:hypothetical protein n=1 Tax=unclassified Alcanivorax TaxID=2638842 RepID=UPI000ACBEAAA|nr:MULTISPECIES: hypothetical protein [unclassified Alcanivorax]